MHDIESIRKYLAERGLHVTLAGCDPGQSPALGIEPAGEPQTSLFRDAGLWVFEHWDTIPGPRSTDFRFAYPSLDDALLGVWNYYFGRPITVDGWCIPMHRHPFWSLPRLQYRLANLVTVTQREIEAIVDERRRRAVANWLDVAERRLEYADITQFIRVEGPSESGRLLFLRRDLDEGFVVSERGPN